jgi:hypothetical protein
MIEVRRSEDRGETRFEWLDSRHSFSFGEYRDPRHMGFRALRAVNEDVIGPSTGFGMHPHEDMEILTVLRSGALAHRDSMGNEAVIRAGDVQRMTAGTGVMHSEHNPSDEVPANLLQIWIEPAELGLEPSYEQRSFDPADPTDTDGWQLVASPDGRDGSLLIHQDVTVHRGRLAAGASAKRDLGPGRYAWLQVVDGEIEIDGHRLRAGDGVAVSDKASIAIECITGSDVLLFDLS